MNEEQKKQIHIVLDLETMGTKQDAAIIEIGMVIFDHTGQEGTVNLLHQYSQAISLENSMYHGGTITADTLLWWMHSDRTEVRDNWLVAPKAPLTWSTLNTIACIILDHSKINPKPLIWGNGVNFDNAILKSAYERLGFGVPWSYRQDADFRTLKLLYKDVVPEPAFVGTPHIALDDARHEADWLSQILQYIYRDEEEKTTPTILGRRPDLLIIDDLLPAKIMGSAVAGPEYELVPLEVVLDELRSKD